MKAYKDEESFWSKKKVKRYRQNQVIKKTKFFQASGKANRSRKSIEMILDGDGKENRSEASKGMVAVDFFTSLFSSTNPSDFNELFQDFIPRVTHSMNVELIRKVTSSEVKEALFSINPSKAPGTDGMTSLLFQQFWEVIGNQVTSEVCNFFETGYLPYEWNYTHLCLIPKKVNSSLMSDLRPINLCSVLYKIIAKILAQR